MWKVTADGIVTKVDVAATLPAYANGAIAVDDAGNVFITANNVIYEYPGVAAAKSVVAVTAGNDTAHTTSQAPVDSDVRANDSVPTGTLNAPTVTTPPTSGTAIVQPSGAIRYTSNAGFVGTDTFTYTVCSSLNIGSCATATVTVTVAAVTPVVTAGEDSATTGQATAVDIAVGANDNVTVGALTAPTVTRAPGHGTTTVLASGVIRYEPVVGFSGTDTFGYTVCSTVAPAVCATANVTVTVASATAVIVPVDPSRLFDTRPDQPQGAVTIVKQRYGGPGNILKVKVTGNSGVPATGVTAVALNVTAVDPVGAGYVTVFPCGTRPEVSSLNYSTGQTVPNAVIAPLSADGEICFYSQADTHLIADVNGWFATGSGFAALPPARVFDTRTDQPQGVVTIAKQKYGGPANILKVKVTGAGGVQAAGVTAVSLNVTVTGPTGPGYLTVFPCGTRPEASSLNYVTGQTVPNAVIAPVSADGYVCFYSQADTDLLADVNGWFSGGTGFQALSPVRVFDTRADQGQGAVPVAKQKIGGTGNILRVHVAGNAGVPGAGAAVVSLNVTVVGPVGAGYVTVFPCGTRPDVSSLNYVTGQTIPNAVLAPLSPEGDVCFYSQADTDLLADVNGWFSS